LYLDLSLSFNANQNISSKKNYSPIDTYKKPEDVYNQQFNFLTKFKG